MRAIEWTFLVSGGLTVAYMLKLYVALFVEKNDDPSVQEKYDSLKGRYMNKVSAFALTVSATLLPVMGFLPGIVMNTMADLGQSFLQGGEAEAITYFSFGNLKGGLISIGIGVLIYLVVVRMADPERRGNNRLSEQMESLSGSGKYHLSAVTA